MIRCQLLKFHEIAILPQPQWHGMAWHGSAVFRSRKYYLQSAENNFIEKRIRIKKDQIKLGNTCSTYKGNQHTLRIHHHTRLTVKYHVHTHH